MKGVVLHHPRLVHHVYMRVSQEDSQLTELQPEYCSTCEKRSYSCATKVTDEKNPLDIESRGLFCWVLDCTIRSECPNIRISRQTVRIGGLNIN